MHFTLQIIVIFLLGETEDISIGGENGEIPYDPIYLTSRTIYQPTVFLDLALGLAGSTQTLAVQVALNFALEKVLSLALTLSLTLALALTFYLDLALALTFYLDLALALTFYLDLALDLDNYLDVALDLDQKALVDNKDMVW